MLEDGPRDGLEPRDEDLGPIESRRSLGLLGLQPGVKLELGVAADFDAEIAASVVVNKEGEHEHISRQGKKTRGWVSG